ncbi:plasmid partitioning protein RepB C-terminal domain-containing protein [Bradyrhizobium iriomotense]|uniref:plasmid partitioning protein RepB C-terminal domain-containing protein n=1 Tax=Bradyrhizobium iriomotense TaxID=441950 RepID=UPI001B8A349C|nr:plasmid partitioning protein RepB C-terminal domain-containing protein [Bradyrhizobium iriomotense]MBR1133254.1 ParB N-terminal domain-containing protein [Bradyrhizobium iriomotense]
MTDITIKSAFEADLLMLPLKALLPVRHITDAVRASRKFKTIEQSVAEVGTIEPLVVFHNPDRQGRYLLLDGHLRRDILLRNGVKETDCLLATDDEAFTYNKRATRLGIIQEHLLILRAIDRGVSEQRIAKALGVDVTFIKQRRNLLRGISSRVVTLLKNKPVNPNTFNVLRKMKPSRQVEACELMIAASNYSLSYARAILAGSSNAERIKPARQSRPSMVTSADLALMDRELQDVRKQLTAVEASYGRDMLDLVVAARYVAELLNNRKMARYLHDNHPEIAREFRAIVSATLQEDAPPSCA